MSYYSLMVKKEKNKTTLDQLSLVQARYRISLGRRLSSPPPPPSLRRRPGEKKTGKKISSGGGGKVRAAAHFLKTKRGTRAASGQPKREARARFSQCTNAQNEWKKKLPLPSYFPPRKRRYKTAPKRNFSSQINFFFRLLLPPPPTTPHSSR